MATTLLFVIACNLAAVSNRSEGVPRHPLLVEPLRFDARRPDSLADAMMHFRRHGYVVVSVLKEHEAAIARNMVWDWMPATFLL